MDASDTARLAQQFLELWQHEISRQMSNPESMRAMLQAMQGFTQGHEATHDATRRTAPASDAEHDAVRELSFRVSALERQLAKLKQSLGSLPAQKPAAKKRRSPARRLAKPERPAKRGGKRPVKHVGRRPLKGKPKPKK